MGGGSPEQDGGLSGAGVGYVRGAGGGWVSLRGLVYCVNEVHLFPWKMAPWGSCHFITVPWGLQRRQVVFRFRTLSRPLFIDFIPLNVLLKHQNPIIASTRLVVPVFGRASFSVVLSNSSLSRAGKEERREERPFSCLPSRLFGALKKATAGSTAQALRVGQGSRT